MKRVTWKRWLAIAGISAVLVGGAGLWAVNHAADFVLKSLGEQALERTPAAAVKEQENSVGQLEGKQGSAEPSPGSGNGKKDGAAYSAEISSDKAEQVRDEVTAQEKAFVMTTILKKFSPDETNLFMRMASGGLSLEEKKEAKKIFLKKLNEEEYDKLIAIASKYGLSQGKNYQDSLKEK